MSYPPPGGQDPYQPPPSGPEGNNPYSPPPTGPISGGGYPPPVGPDSGNPYAQPTAPQPAYPQPYGQQYGQYPAVPVAATGTNGLSIASMITGIASIPIACCCSPLAIVGGATAVGLGFVGLKQTRERGQGGRGMAIAGIATGGVGLLLGIILLILGASNAMTGWLDDLSGTNGDDDFDFD
jgi:hypothetical protein